MPDPTGGGQPTPWRRRLLWLVTVLLVVAGGITLLTARNAFGRNVTGTATCEHGPVVGVWFESQSPFTPSDWAKWEPATLRPGDEPGRSAVFHVWLKFGGKAAYHVGCGGTGQNWATDNWSPFTDAGVVNLYCPNPVTVPGAPTVAYTDGGCVLTG